MPRPPRQHPVDVHVGQQLRTQRALFGLSQVELAKQLGITFQQVQKYETGSDRLSASRLWEAGKALGAPISYFFEGLGKKTEPAADILGTRAGLELVRDFEGCSEKVQELASLLCKATADDLNSAAGKKTKSALRKKAK